MYLCVCSGTNSEQRSSLAGEAPSFSSLVGQCRLTSLEKKVYHQGEHQTSAAHWNRCIAVLSTLQNAKPSPSVPRKNPGDQSLTPPLGPDAPTCCRQRPPESLWCRLCCMRAGRAAVPGPQQRPAGPTAGTTLSEPEGNSEMRMCLLVHKSHDIWL